MKKNHIKYQFSLKTKEELRDLPHEELFKYLQDSFIQENLLKNTTNSSICPSSEIAPFRKKSEKNQSLREKSNKSVGGQAEREEVTLTQSDTPDEIIEVPFTFESCKKCGCDISAIVAKPKEQRQVIDLELSSADTKTTEYQSFSKICPTCGYNNYDNAFAKSVTPGVSYGKTIIAMVAYLSASQYMPSKRIAQLLLNLFNLSLSEGSVNNLLAKASKLSENKISKIKEVLSKTEALGIDETGYKVDGVKHWHWTFQDENNTLMVADKSRGTQVIKDTFESGFVNTCVVHGNYSSYSSLECASEQLCLSHKMRDLNYAIKCDNTKLAKDLKELLKEAIKEELTVAQRAILKAQYNKSLEYLLTMPFVEKSETHKQVKSLQKSKHKIFTFLLDDNIPPDNNTSERAIRNVKVKQKVSGRFKSLEGAQYYANIGSVVDTSRRRGLNEFETLQSVIEGHSLF